MKTSLFKLSLLSSALLSCSVFAQNAVEVKKSVLPMIEVTAQDGVQTKTNVVTTEKINKSTETDLRGLLKDEPSINFGGGNGTSQWITIRGMGQDQINLVVDGGSIDAQIFHHQGRFSLDPSLVKIVKVQKGTGTASAGLGMNNGAIVAKTVDALDLLRDDQDYGFKVQGNYANNDEHSYGGSVFVRAGKFDFLVGGTQTDQSNYQAGKKDGSNYEVQNSALDKRGLLAKVGVSLNENHRVVLGHRQELNKGVRNLREEFDFVQSSSNRNDARYRELETNQTTLEWTGKDLGFLSKINVDAAYTENKRKDMTNGLLGGATGVKAKTANVNLESEITQNSVLKYGVNYRQQESFGTDKKISQEKKDIGLYVESVNKIGDVTLMGGLRYDAFDFSTSYGGSRSDYDLNPSVALAWQVLPQLSLNASHNYATRSPRFGESALSGSRRQYVIGQDTVADRTRSTELGFNYEHNGFNLDGSYFWSHTKNLGSIQGNVITNNGQLKNTGYELNTAYQWQALKFKAGVAYNKPTLNGASIDNVTVAMPIGRTWTSGVSYQFDTPSIEVGWNGRLVQKTSYTTATGEIREREGYNVHDVFATWQPLHNDRLNVNFAINNVFDKYYKSHSQRAVVNALPAAGRDFRVGFNYTF